MDELNKSFRVRRSNSCLGRIVGRSASSRLVVESVSSECLAISGYQRLSQSMRFADEPPVPTKEQQQRNNSRSWRLILSRAFSGRRYVEEMEGEKEEKKTTAETMRKKKRWSSWLPDPERRWPVQGW